MTSLPAVSVVEAFPSLIAKSAASGRSPGASGSAPRRPRKPSKASTRSDANANANASVALLMPHGRGALGRESIDIHFNDVECQTLDRNGVHAIGELIIETRGADLLIEQLDNEHVLTGRGGHHIDCRILFRHAYGRMICRLGVDRLTADTHIGLIESRSFKEIQSFNFSRPRHVGHDGGGSLWTHLEYRASPLNEIQGITWRGGSLRLASLTLIP